jgi:glutathione S-transferase
MEQLEKITLYGFVTSPFVQKVNAYLVYKELEYKVVLVDPVRPTQIRFTRQRQVPVLMIDNEWRVDSSPIGIWLDQRFPQQPLLGESEAERQTIVAIDRWVSHMFIPSMLFRSVYEWQDVRTNLLGPGRLAHLLHTTRKLPAPYRVIWPLAVRKAPFIVHMMRSLDLSEPIDRMRERIWSELKQHLGDGPFLGGLQRPSLADLSLYAVIISPFMTMGTKGGTQTDAMLPQDAELRAWLKRVDAAMPKRPLLAHPSCVTRAELP